MIVTTECELCEKKGIQLYWDDIDIMWLCLECFEDEP